MLSSDKTLRVLSIEASSVDCDLIKETLKKLGIPFLLERIFTKEELEVALNKETWDLVISEFELPGLTCREALERVHKSRKVLPFVLVCKGIGEESVADMMKAGIEDFVSKSRIERLLPTVKRVLREQAIRQKEASAPILAQKASAAREQMLAIVSHDIKNPLCAIQLEAQMLLRVCDRHVKSLLGEEVKIQANRILKTTERLKGLITDLLGRNKSENSLSVIHKETVEVTGVFQDVLDAVRPLIQEKSISIETQLPPQLRVELDKAKMFQVFMNLLSNAIKFTPENGTILIGVDDYEDRASFFVIDSGPGLKEEELPQVFEKYWTGKTPGRSGSGLGLFICKTIVEAHGGQIAVENRPEGGARFSFTVPKKPLSVFTRKSKGNILVIDDDEDLREVMAWVLGNEGYAVHSFKEPGKALEFLNGGKNLPELILVDYHMHGMRGEEFLSLKSGVPLQRVRETPVVMISASPGEVESFVPKGLYKEVLTKPIDLEALVVSMQKYLH